MPSSEEDFSKQNPPLQDILQKLGLWQRPEHLQKVRTKALYAFAYDLYQKSQYAEAKKIFLYLVLCAEFDPKNLLGMAACFHAEKDHTIALSIYQLCIRSKLDHPIIHFHISDCLLSFGNKRDAINELKKVLEIPYGSTDSEKLRNKARGMIDLLEGDLAQ